VPCQAYVLVLSFGLPAGLRISVLRSHSPRVLLLPSAHSSRVLGLLHDSFCRSRCSLMPLSGFYAWSSGLLLCSVSPTHVPVRNASRERVSVMDNGVLRRRTHEADQKQEPKVNASSRRNAGFTMWGPNAGVCVQDSCSWSLGSPAPRCRYERVSDVN